MEQVYGAWGTVAPISVYAGGMIVGNRVGTIAEKASYIETAYQDVERLTGIRFGSAFVDHVLKKGEMVLESTTPATALVVHRALQLPHPTRFAHRLQQAVYRDGMDLSSPSTYEVLAAELNVDAEDFVAAMQTEDIRRAAQEEFDYVAELGITGFPTLVLAVADEAHVVAQGYRPFENINATLQELLSV